MHALPPPSYFTCTLSDALRHNQAHHNVQTEASPDGLICNHLDFRNVNGFIDFLASNHGGNLAIGCVTPVKNTLSMREELLTFSHLHSLSRRLGQHFSTHLHRNPSSEECVGLLASSSVLFVVVYFGLMRAGYEVLLIAPQISPGAIRHLLQLAGASAICFDADNETSVSEALEPQSTDQHARRITRLKLPWVTLEDLQHADLHASHNENSISDDSATMASIAYYRHSSGTTGLPKLIPQTHNGAVGILRRLQSPSDPSAPLLGTFTTTPLYSGGNSDLFRSWSAASPLWIFPEGRAPITSATVSSCIQYIDTLSHRPDLSFTRTQLGFLTCVPFILEALMSDSSVHERLRSFAAVGVGGAAMPPALGDQAIQAGIRLVTRFGSSEVGFLLSSERDFDSNMEWQVMQTKDLTGLEFRPVSDGEDGHYELIVTQDWPSVSLAAHAKRPFNTHDVFTPHPNIPGAWAYVGRSDAQLTLSTGKKFDPTSIEHILRQHHLIVDAVVVGDDKPFAAAIVFQSSEEDPSNERERTQSILEHVQEVNKQNPSHARFTSDTLCVLPASQHVRLRKNNKGLILRNTIPTEFAIELDRLYGSNDSLGSGNLDLTSSDSIHNSVRMIVHNAFHIHLEPEDDFFDAGLDSASSLQIRRRICDSLPSHLPSQVPLHVVYECGTMDSLVKYIVDLTASDDSRGYCKSTSNGVHSESKADEMYAMVNNTISRQSKLLQQTSAHVADIQLSSLESNLPDDDRMTVVLTGSTGFLGTHLLHTLLENPQVAKIYLLIRGSTQVSPEEHQKSIEARIHAALKHHDLLPESMSSGKPWPSKLEAVPFHLREPDLGIPTTLYARLASEVTHIIHAAWEVNFNLPLKTFASSISGTVHLFNLALLAAKRQRQSSRTRAPSFLFCSSVASIARVPAEKKPARQHELSYDADDAANIGYAQSKWVAESVLAELTKTHTNVQVSILRVGQLSGATGTGIWNAREAWPLMIHAGFHAFSIVESESGDGKSQAGSTGKSTIILPDLSSTTLPPIDWLPVDIAAEQIHTLITQREQPHQHQPHPPPFPSISPSPSVLPIANLQRSTRIPWSQLQAWISTWAAEHGRSCMFIDPSEWLEKLERAGVEHQARALTGLWRGNWRRKEGDGKDEERVERKHTSGEGHGSGLESRGAEAILDEAYFRRVLDWIASLP